MVSKIPDNSRYSEKKYLSRYDLFVDLFDKFDLKVVDVVPLRSVFILFTNKGKKILKKVETSKDNLDFIYSSINYIKRSFPRVMDFVKTKDGEIYTTWRKEIYCVLDLIEGRECEFSNPVDLSIAARGVAQLHSAGEGFRTEMKERNQIGRTVQNFERALNEMIFFKNLANLHEIKDDFDTIYLDNVDYYTEQIQRSITDLKASSYLKLCGEEDKTTICHHDLAHHNILINEDLAYFIDFDYAVVDLKVQDLSNFINKAIKNYAFDIDRANSIIEDYCTCNSLDRREKEVLAALLRFPEDFYSISKDYYSRRKDWEEEVFIDRLSKKVDYKQDREEFLESFAQKMSI